MPHPMLAPLPYAEWKPTKTTLQLMCQIVGKIRLGHTPYRSHWWNVTLRPTARGLSTQRMRSGTTFFDMEFDFVEHELVIRATTAHEPARIALYDGLSVAAFYAKVFAALAAFGIGTAIVDRPYGMPGEETPFSRDDAHASYDRVMVRRWWEIVLWSADVFDQYASSFVGKESPAQLFWHSFDLAIARFSGRSADVPRKTDPVQQEAYSHEVISVGFWAGDTNITEPSYYTYTAPEPPALTTKHLAPAPAQWISSGNAHLGILPYEAVRTADDPRAALLAFAHAAFAAGSDAAAWPSSPSPQAYCGEVYRADR
jgi:hypothetical protein